MKKISWGILGTATIAVEKVIAAMQKGKHTHVAAIASRNLEKAEQIARQFNIPRAWGSYEELIKDPEISAIYIPLPNNLHVIWSIKALEAGKHVLCEKPISLSISEAEYLQKESQRYPGLKIMEAFMYRFHPQWKKVKDLISTGEIGKLRTINSHFSFFDDNPQSIVNQKELGGGSLLDIGCYNISLSRYLFDTEPTRVLGNMVIDTRYDVEIQTNGIMDFNEGKSSIFTSATRQTEYQKVSLLGTSGMIEMDSPFIVDADQKAVLHLQKEQGRETIIIDPCDQYTEQVETFSRSILFDQNVPTPLSDAVANMRTIESLIQSAATKKWIYLNRD